MRTQALILLCILAFAVKAVADEPPSWRDFEVKSGNGKFLAEVKAKADQKNLPYFQWKYELTVYQVDDQSKVRMWSANYKYDGYAEGMLSDDGSKFVYVNFWYYRDAPVVSIYGSDLSVKVLYGGEFHINMKKFRKHTRSWLSIEPSQVEFSNMHARPLLLKILTIDKKPHIVDLETGRLLR